MGTGPWSEITDFPPEEPQQQAAAKVRTWEDGGGPTDETAIMLDIRTPRWWLPWERMTAVRMWTRASNKWRAIAYFHQPIQALNYAEVLAHSIARHHNMEAVGESPSKAN